MAKRILAEIGMEVHQPGLLELLRSKGLRTVDQRVYFDPQLVDETADEVRRIQTVNQQPASKQDDGRLTLWVSS
jgi:trimethylamine:corrinoid methyltransferase-like protein